MQDFKYFLKALIFSKFIYQLFILFQGSGLGKISGKFKKMKFQKKKKKKNGIGQKIHKGIWQKIKLIP